MEGSSLREVIFTPLTGMRPTSLDGSKSGQVTSKVPWTIVSPGDGGVKGRLRVFIPSFMAAVVLVSSFLK